MIWKADEALRGLVRGHKFVARVSRHSPETERQSRIFPETVSLTMKLVEVRILAVWPIIASQ